jgi:hypothetical protein
VTGTTLFTQGISATTFSAITVGSSANCISDLYVSSIHSCSPLLINPLNEGQVIFGQSNQMVLDLSNKYVGFNKVPTFPFDFTTTFGTFGFKPSVVNSNMQISGTSNQFTSILFVAGTSSLSVGSYGLDYSSGGFATGDTFVQASANNNSLQIITLTGDTGNKDIKLKAGRTASDNSDLFIKGTGTTRGYVGFGTENPTERVDVSGKTKTINLQITSGASAGYVLVSDASGNAIWSAALSASTISATTISATTSVTSPTITTSSVQNTTTFRLDIDTGSQVIQVYNSGYQTKFYPSGQLEIPNNIIGGTFGGNQLQFGSSATLAGLRNNEVFIQTGTGGTADNTFKFGANTFYSPVISATTISATTFNLAGSQIESEWTSYVPVWTAASVDPVLNNGTLTGKYKLIGKTCFVRLRLQMGSTTTYGTGAWYFSLPFNAVSAYGVIMPATMLNNGAAWYSGIVNGGRLGNTSKSEIQWQNTGGTADGISPTVPFTWGDTDELEFNGSYEIA